MKVGVTGGFGFIGGHVREALRRAGHVPVVFDRHDRARHVDEEFFLGDIRDATAVTEFAAHVEGIVHLAAVLGTQETILNPQPSVDTNIGGSLAVFEAAVQYDLPVVYAGVGNHWMRNHAAGAYTITKAAAEDFARMFNAYRGGRITVVRPVNAYGPGQAAAQPYGPSKVRKIIPAFVCRALSGHDVEIYGDGTQVSDCVYVEDVARVIVCALEQTQGALPIVEVGPATSTTVNEVARLVVAAAARHTGQEAAIRYLPMRPGEVPNAVVSADVSTLAVLPECHPETFVSLEEGIARTVNWFAARR